MLVTGVTATSPGLYGNENELLGMRHGMELKYEQTYY